MTDSNVPPSGGTVDTSLSLLERVKKQDQAAWYQLEQLYTPLVLRWCGQWGLKDADSEDRRQEVFTAVFNAIGAFRREPPAKTFRKWLRTITHNKVRDYWQRIKYQPAAAGGSDHQAWLNELPAGPPDDEATAQEEESELVRRALELLRAQFEPETWQAWWRTAVDGQPVKDVAKELGLSGNAVYLARSRVRKRLETEFRGLLDLAP